MEHVQKGYQQTVLHVQVFLARISPKNICTLKKLANNLSY